MQVCMYIIVVCMLPECVDSMYDGGMHVYFVDMHSCAYN